jgi:hypothetical protein
VPVTLLLKLVLAPLLVVGSSLAGRRWGDRVAAAVRTVVGLTRGPVGFAMFCFLLAVLLVPWGIAGAFGAAIAGTLVVQVCWMLWASWRSERAGTLGETARTYG